MKKFIYIVMGVLMMGCGDPDRPPKPDDLIPKEKMSDILYDVFVLTAAKGINKRILEQNSVFPQAYVYKKHDIDSLQFAKSNDYYSYDTKTYQEIMLEVKQRIEYQRKRNDSINLKEQKVKDSIIAEKERLRDSLPKPLKVESKLDTILPKKPRKSKVFGKDDR